jgi:nucleotide-binding universal stress UspA family protein
MSFKTILVHQADDQRYRQRLEVAIGLARRFDAHLNLVYLTTPVTTPVGIRGRGASLAYIAEATEVGREHARDVEKVVLERCRGNAPSWEWHIEEGELDKAIADHAHLSDLVIVGQTPLEHLEDRVILHLPDHLVVHIGCPMLLVPAKGQIDTVGQRIIVAWKSGREALQAVRGSLPFLQTAETVTVLTGSNGSGGQQAQDGIGAYLQRHGIRAEVIPIEDHLSGVGDIILRKAAEIRCDLVVMGAYAHSRLREIVLGGTTDFMMRHSTVPILMAH